MVTKGIRGAITVEANTKEALEEATLELLSEMFEKNEITGTSKISHIKMVCRNCKPCKQRIMQTK